MVGLGLLHLFVLIVPSAVHWGRLVAVGAAGDLGAVYTIAGTRVVLPVHAVVAVERLDHHVLLDVLETTQLEARAFRTKLFGRPRLVACGIPLATRPSAAATAVAAAAGRDTASVAVAKLRPGSAHLGCGLCV